MLRNQHIALLIPARDEEESLPVVLKQVPDLIDRVLVVDNGSIDKTPDIARRLGAEVVREPVGGYGRACLAGIAALSCRPPDIVLFSDADGSDDMGMVRQLVGPLAENLAEFTLAARTAPEKGALSKPQKYGNMLAVFLIRLFWGHAYADLGPMRAITWQALNRLNMSDPDYGWTVEMQIRALKAGLRVREIPSAYQNRVAGRSKVSKAAAGVAAAGSKILWVIFREAVSGCLPVNRRHMRGQRLA